MIVQSRGEQVIESPSLFLFCDRRRGSEWSQQDDNSQLDEHEGTEERRGKHWQPFDLDTLPAQHLHEAIPPDAKPLQVDQQEHTEKEQRVPNSERETSRPSSSAQ